MAEDGEDTLCLKILQQQSDSISRKNKLFVSSSKLAFRENCIKRLSAPVKHLRNKIYNNYLVTLKLQLFTSISVKIGCKDPFNKRIVSTTVCFKRKINSRVANENVLNYVHRRENALIRVTIRESKI